MENTKKVTKKEYFAMLKEMVQASKVANKEDMLAFIEHEVELLAKKSAKSGQTKTQKENAVTMEVIVQVLTDFGRPVTVTELMTDTRLGSFSNQKLSALLRGLGKEGKVVRTEDKKKAYFSIP